MYIVYENLESCPRFDFMGAERGGREREEESRK